MKPNGEEGTLDGGVVGFYSLEMSAEQLAARILSEAAEIPSEQIRKGDMTEGEFRQFVDAAKSLESCRFISMTHLPCQSHNWPRGRVD